MYDAFTFNGLSLEPGDVVSMQAKSVPLPPSVVFQAAVIELTEAGDLEVASTQLAIFEHTGIFPAEDVLFIVLDNPAAEAVAIHAGTPLARGQLAEVVIDGHPVRATVTAAIDGFVVGLTADGIFVGDGSSGWIPVAD